MPCAVEGAGYGGQQKIGNAVCAFLAFGGWDLGQPVRAVAWLRVLAPLAKRKSDQSIEIKRG